MILHQASGSIVNPWLSLCQANVKTPEIGPSEFLFVRLRPKAAPGSHVVAIYRWRAPSFFNNGRKSSMNQNSMSIPLSPEKAIFRPSGDQSSLPA